MFRIRKSNTVFETSGEGTSTGGTTQDGGLVRIDTEPNTNTGSSSTIEDPTLSSTMVVQEVEGKGGNINVTLDATRIQFDKTTGFHVTDMGNDTAFVELGSSFADIYVDGQTTLEAKGEDELEIIAGDGIKITTTTENSGSATKAIKFSTVNKGIFVIDASDESEELPLFLDMLDNPCNYKGAVVYLTAVGPTSRPDPFLWPDKFYFNEGCEWFESPFALGRQLDDLD